MERLSIRVKQSIDNREIEVEYKREFPSLEAFLVEFSEAYDTIYGKQKWSVCIAQ